MAPVAGFTDVVPDAGGVVTTTEAGFSVPPLPESLARTLMATAWPEVTLMAPVDGSFTAVGIGPLGSGRTFTVTVPTLEVPAVLETVYLIVAVPVVAGAL